MIENLYENLITVSQSLVEIAILFGNEMISKVYQVRYDKLFWFRLQSTNNISFQKSYCPTEIKMIWDTIGKGNKTNLVIKYK